MLNLNFTPFPTITTQRLVLRQLQDDDVHELFALRTDERVNRFLDRPLPESLNDVREFIKKVNQITYDNEGLYWVITRKNEDKLLGTIGLRNFGPEQYQAEIGYELHPDHHAHRQIGIQLRRRIRYRGKCTEQHECRRRVPGRQ